MKQIDKMLENLYMIGFKAINGDNKIQIVGFSGEQELLLEEITHLIRVFIIFDEPHNEDFDYLWQGCSLKVYFDKPELQNQAKEIKFYIATILNEYGLFNKEPYLQGIKITNLPSTPQEMIVP